MMHDDSQSSVPASNELHASVINSSSSPSVPTPSSPNISQQLQNLTVASPDVGQQCPEKDAPLESREVLGSGDSVNPGACLPSSYIFSVDVITQVMMMQS
jgi:hypothetical protein